LQLFIQVTVKSAVQVVTGDVRVNGAVTSVSDEANHVEVVSKSRDRKEVFFIKFKALKCGFSKEVKLKRRAKRPPYTFSAFATPHGFYSKNPVPAER